MIIHKLDFLLLDGDNVVLSDRLDILNVIVLNEEDIDHIFAPIITLIHFETPLKKILISRSYLKVQEWFSTFKKKISWAFQKRLKFLS